MGFVFILGFFIERVRKTAESDYYLRHVCPYIRLSVLCRSVCPQGTIRIPPDGFFMKFNISGFFENLSSKSMFH
jgi:hypothetical protein